MDHASSRPPRLAFGDTSVASLVDAVRRALPPDAPSPEWERVEHEISTQADALVRSYRHNVFFNDFFRANGAAAVTPLFCALDKVWAEALEEPRFGVRFERPTTLAAGDDAYRFQFRKSEPA